MAVKWRWLRHPKTTQEKRQHYRYPELTRPKRRPKRLVSAWDDFFIPSLKSWKHKSKKRKQYL